MNTLKNSRMLAILKLQLLTQDTVFKSYTPKEQETIRRNILRKIERQGS